MENTELEHLSALLARAQAAEEIFGHLAGTRVEMFEAARGTFRHLAKALHPDKHQGATASDRADAAFKKLSLFWEQARIKIENGTYGTARSAETFAPFTIRTRKYLYAVEHLIAHGDLCAVYAGSTALADGQSNVLLKVPIKPENNDLAANEATSLTNGTVSVSRITFPCCVGHFVFLQTTPCDCFSRIPFRFRPQVAQREKCKERREKSPSCGKA